MANSYNAGGKYFDIDTDVDVAGLTTLKSGACASDDSIYIAEEATVTIDSNTDCLKVYLGDNQAGTASTKTGHLLVDGDATLTLYSTVVSDGLTGEGTTSTITLDGTDGHLAEIAANTANKVTNANIAGCMITSNYGKFTQFYVIYAGAAYDLQNTIFNKLGTYGYYFSAAYDTLPASLDGSEFTGCDAAIYDAMSTSHIDWLEFFATSEVKFTGTVDGSSAFSRVFGTTTPISRYMYHREDSASMKDAPAWDSTTGIQTLTDNANGTLTAEWNGATHGAGDTVRYRIYVRKDSAPDSFGVSSNYYLCETTDESFKLCALADGTAFANNDDIYVIVRAVTALSDEDTNTTNINTTVTTTSADTATINRIDRTTQTILALELSG